MGFPHYQHHSVPELVPCPQALRHLQLPQEWESLVCAETWLGSKRRLIFSADIRGFALIFLLVNYHCLYLNNMQIVTVIQGDETDILQLGTLSSQRNDLLSAMQLGDLIFILHHLLVTVFTCMSNGCFCICDQHSMIRHLCFAYINSSYCGEGLDSNQVGIQKRLVYKRYDGQLYIPRSYPQSS